MTEDKMARWHHQLNGHEFEQAPGDGRGHRSLACCSPRGHRVRYNLVIEHQQQGIHKTISLSLCFFSVLENVVVFHCPTLCDPTGCSIPGFFVLHYLLEFAQI